MLSDDTVTANLSADSTVSLLPMAARGDGRAAAILLERMRPFLKRIGHGRLPPWARGRAETEDLVQESLIRAFKQIPRFEGQSMRDFRNWLHTVFRNLVIDETRYVRRSVPMSQEGVEGFKDDALSPEERMAEQEQAQVFEAALGRLNRKERLYVVYRLQHGYSFHELGDKLGAPSTDAARMTYNRALKTFRNVVRELVARDGNGKRRSYKTTARSFSPSSSL